MKFAILLKMCLLALTTRSLALPQPPQNYHAVTDRTNYMALLGSFDSNIALTFEPAHGIVFPTTSNPPSPTQGHPLSIPPASVEEASENVAFGTFFGVLGLIIFATFIWTIWRWHWTRKARALAAIESETSIPEFIERPYEFGSVPELGSVSMPSLAYPHTLTRYPSSRRFLNHFSPSEKHCCEEGALRASLSGPEPFPPSDISLSGQDLNLIRHVKPVPSIGSRPLPDIPPIVPSWLRNKTYGSPRSSPTVALPLLQEGSPMRIPPHLRSRVSTPDQLNSFTFGNTNLQKVASPQGKRYERRTQGGLSSDLEKDITENEHDLDDTEVDVHLVRIVKPADEERRRGL